MALTPTTVDDFSGGITDFIKGSDKSQFQFGDNVLIDRAKAWLTRPGSRLVDSAADRPAGVTTRISSLWNFNEDTALFAQNAAKMFRYDAAGHTWTELQGPGAHSYFPGSTTAARVTGGTWKGHLLTVASDGAYPMKTYQDSGGNFVSVTAGLPAFVTLNAYSATTTATAAFVNLANALRTNMLAHFADATAHSTGADTVSGVAPYLSAAALSVGDSLATTIILVKQLMDAYHNHYADAMRAQNSRLYHPNTYVRPGAPNVLLAYNTAPVTWLDVGQRLNDLKIKYNWHVSSFKGHYDPTHSYLATQRVVVADLTGTEEGPIFGAEDYTQLLAFVNNVKAQFNAHVSDTSTTTTDDATHNTTYAFAGVADTENKIYIPDATDLTSLKELAAHVYSGYREHHADLLLPIISLDGLTSHTNKTLISSVTQVSGDPKLGSIFDLDVGMYVNVIGGTGDGYAKGTTVTAANTTTKVITLSANNDNTGTDGGTVLALFSKIKFHTIVAVATSSSGKGTVTELDIASIISDIGVLIAAMKDTALKFNSHDSNFGASTATVHINYSAHQIKTIPGLNNSPDIVEHSYVYGFVFAREYTTLSGEQFRDVSTPLYKTLITLKTIEERPPTIDCSTMMSLPTSAAFNYSTADTNVEIYRTIDAGSVPYFSGSVANAFAGTYRDTVGDTEIQGNSRIYTAGGVLANDPPPRARAMHITKDGRAFYGATTRVLLDGTTETILNRVEEAVQDDPDSVPAGNFLDLPEDFVAISSVRTIPIVGTGRAIYRIDGQFTEQGQGQLKATAISEEVGVKAGTSFVQLDGAVAFAGADQFYMTDGYTLTPLGKAWPKTFAKLVSNATRASNILGVYEPKGKRVWWAASQNADENDSCFIFDTNYPIRAEVGGCFTTASGGASFAPTALCIYQGKLIRGDSRGYVFMHDDAYSSDPTVNTATSGANWYTQPVIYRYKSVSLPLGPDAVRKWASLFELKMGTPGDASIQVNSDNDLGRNVKGLTAIRRRGATSQIDEKRYFPRGALFFTDKQVEITNAYLIVANSDAYGLLAASAGVLTGTFPADMVGFKVAFAVDNYVTEHLITAQTGTTILQAAGSPDNAATKWVIRGYPKTEQVGVREYSVWSMLMGNNQTSAVGETGANA